MSSCDVARVSVANKPALPFGAPLHECEPDDGCHAGKTKLEQDHGFGGTVLAAVAVRSQTNHHHRHVRQGMTHGVPVKQLIV